MRLLWQSECSTIMSPRDDTVTTASIIEWVIKVQRELNHIPIGGFWVYSFCNSLIFREKNSDEALNIQAVDMRVQMNVYHRLPQEDQGKRYYTSNHKG